MRVHVWRFTLLRKFAKEYGLTRHIPEPWQRMILLALAKGCPEFADYFAANTECPGEVTIPEVEKFVRLLARYGGHSWSTATDRKYKFLKLLRDERFTEQQPLAAIRDEGYGIQPEKMPDIPIKTQTESFRSFILSGCTVNSGNSKWESKPGNPPRADDLKREEGTGTRRAGTAKMAVDAIAWVFGFALSQYGVVIETLEQLLESAARSRGSGGFGPESRVPPPEEPFQFVIEDLGPCLEQEMCSAEGPLHLLFLDESSADYLVDRRLNECRADSFALSPSLAKVRDELAVVLDVYLELGQPVGNF